jgi:hypothetical protein
MNMAEVKQWGIEAKKLVAERIKHEQAMQRITYGGKTILQPQGKVLNFADFTK